jgi:O-antigen/teichoic acid export membrane protein
MHQFRVELVLALYILVETIVYVCVLFRIKLSFKNLKKRIFEIYIYNKSFGFNVYIGSVVALGFGQLTGILISYFGIDNSGVGFYSLALTFTLPLSLIPNTIATTHYKDFSSAKQIPKKLLYITIGLSLFSIIALWIIVPPFITYFYGEEFLSVVKLNFIVSFGVIAHGFGDFYNRFLGANGQGRSLRNSSFFVGGSMLLFNLIFIPKWGEYGAAFAKLITGLVYITTIILYYYRYIRNNKK